MEVYTLIDCEVARSQVDVDYKTSTYKLVH